MNPDYIGVVQRSFQEFDADPTNLGKARIIRDSLDQTLQQLHTDALSRGVLAEHFPRVAYFLRPSVCRNIEDALEALRLLPSYGELAMRLDSGESAEVAQLAKSFAAAGGTLIGSSMIINPNYSTVLGKLGWIATSTSIRLVCARQVYLLKQAVDGIDDAITLLASMKLDPTGKSAGNN